MTKVYVPDFFGDIQEIDSSQLQWRPSAYAIVVKDQTVLTIRYKDGRYDLPGGAVEFGEMPPEAVVREVKEETGIGIFDPELIDIKSTFYRPSSGINSQTLMMYYMASMNSEPVVQPVYDVFETEHVEGPVWLPLQMLSDIDTASTVDWRDIVTAHVQ